MYNNISKKQEHERRRAGKVHVTKKNNKNLQHKIRGLWIFHHLYDETNSIKNRPDSQMEVTKITVRWTSTDED